MPNKINHSPPGTSSFNNKGVLNKTVEKIKKHVITKILSARLKKIINTPKKPQLPTHNSQENSSSIEIKTSALPSGLELLALVAISDIWTNNQPLPCTPPCDNNDNASPSVICVNENEVMTLNSTDKGPGSADDTESLPASAKTCNSPPVGPFAIVPPLDASAIQINSIEILLMSVVHPFFIEYMDNINATVVINEFHHHWKKEMYSEFEKNKHRPSKEMEESLWITMIHQAISGTIGLEPPTVRDNAEPVEQGANSKPSQSDNAAIPAPDSRQKLHDVLTLYLKLLINFFTYPAV